MNQFVAFTDRAHALAAAGARADALFRKFFVSNIQPTNTPDLRLLDHGIPGLV
jgi:hypothetical protein